MSVNYNYFFIFVLFVSPLGHAEIINANQHGFQVKHRVEVSKKLDQIYDRFLDINK